MSQPSNWPLTSGAVRFILPKATTQALAAHPLACDLYPTSLGFYPHACGHFIRRPRHDDWLILYCVGGRAVAEVGDRKVTVVPGDMLAFPPGVSHAYWTLDEDPWTVYWVHFTGTKAHAYWRHAGFSEDRFVYSLSVRAKLAEEFKFLLDSRRSPHNLKMAVHTAHVVRDLLSYLALIWPATKSSRSQLDLERIHSLMLQQLEGTLQLDELAAAAHLSRYQFAHEYRRQTGVSPIAHFIRLKIDRACYILDTSTLSIKEIGNVLGYTDPYYFSRQFKKVMGYSPEHYRRLNKG